MPKINKAALYKEYRSINFRTKLDRKPEFHEHNVVYRKTIGYAAGPHPDRDHSTGGRELTLCPSTIFSIKIIQTERASCYLRYRTNRSFRIGRIILIRETAGNGFKKIFSQHYDSNPNLPSQLL